MFAEVLRGEAGPIVRPDQTKETSRGEPVGAYLRSITVSGFRGIGPEVRIPLHPGPGLIVVAGRNGSGKSTIAEALEMALTGESYRWLNRTAVWTDSWRNLHGGATASIKVEIAEEGPGPGPRNCRICSGQRQCESSGGVCGVVS
jgi:AAA domain